MAVTWSCREAGPVSAPRAAAVGRAARPTGVARSERCRRRALPAGPPTAPPGRPTPHGRPLRRPPGMPANPAGRGEEVVGPPFAADRPRKGRRRLRPIETATDPAAGRDAVARPARRALGTTRPRLSPRSRPDRRPRPGWRAATDRRAERWVALADRHRPGHAATTSPRDVGHGHRAGHRYEATGNSSSATRALTRR